MRKPCQPKSARQKETFRYSFFVLRLRDKNGPQEKSATAAATASTVVEPTEKKNNISQHYVCLFVLFGIRSRFGTIGPFQPAGNKLREKDKNSEKFMKILISSTEKFLLRRKSFTTPSSCRAWRPTSVLILCFSFEGWLSRMVYGHGRRLGDHDQYDELLQQSMHFWHCFLFLRFATLDQLM